MAKIKILHLEPEEALKHAIQVEMDLERFCEAALERAETARQREVFEKISSEEHSHRQFFERRYEELTGRRILYLNVDRRRRLAEIALCPEAGRSLLEQAVENEERAATFYDDAARLIQPGWLRAKFEEMANTEREHLAWLRACAAEEAGASGRAAGERSRVGARAA
jgi:rubrerythrin